MGKYLLFITLNADTAVEQIYIHMSHTYCICSYMHLVIARLVWVAIQTCLLM